MITNVRQRDLWRSEDHPEGSQRGDCQRACVSSVFGLRYEDCEGITGDSASINTWLDKHIPGVQMLEQNLTPKEYWGKKAELDDYKEWPTRHYEQGYWIAGVWSPRVPDVEQFGCGCPSHTEDGKPKPDCKWCGGVPESRSMGILWGLHAVVMKGAQLAWDPHPDADGTIAHFSSAMTFRIVDPSRVWWIAMNKTWLAS